MQSFVTGIEQISDPNNFNFYPNPTTRKIYLSVNDNIQKNKKKIPTMPE